MLKIYGSEMCPDCISCKKDLDHFKIEYEYIDINRSLADLKAFLALRDENPLYDEIRKKHAIGIPTLVRDDGSIFLDHKEYLKEKGLEVPAVQVNQTCSLDGKGC